MRIMAADTGIQGDDSDSRNQIQRNNQSKYQEVMRYGRQYAECSEV